MIIFRIGMRYVQSSGVFNRTNEARMVGVPTARTIGSCYALASRSFINACRADEITCRNDPQDVRRQSDLSRRVEGWTLESVPAQPA
jgi:hypothetical protein